MKSGCSLKSPTQEKYTTHRNGIITVNYEDLVGAVNQYQAPVKIHNTKNWHCQGELRRPGLLLSINTKYLSKYTTHRNGTIMVNYEDLVFAVNQHQIPVKIAQRV